jgi:hypothetical protein
MTILPLPVVKGCATLSFRGDVAASMELGLSRSLAPRRRALLVWGVDR